ncbi:molybdopterin-dependent oxidoreductase [Desulfovibrio mangrovi]|uniref:molybdopterin-dependent oxidoreductase n=1 Tax=Desulfovibrio mangrovi TaxID=2976983 RepID=UPI0022486A44|nr:molybdopterin-dependent oxidoreductase [Desulfovibrio mangrovi]UZP68452.1 molybdopterin-dependent oxidoreductase [Desulfovibrio mangrovi]
MKLISACTLDCPDACSVIIEKKDDGSVSITGNPEHPFTKGFICSKGRKAYERLSSPERITTPLMKVNGEFVPTDWETALDRIADKLKALKEEPASILHVRSHGYRGALAEASHFLFRSLGASATRGALCDDAGIEASIMDFGALHHNDPHDLLNAGFIVNWGKDLSRSSLHMGQIIKEARKLGRKVISISPGGDGNADYSDTVIRIRPGTDRFLAAAIIRKLLVRGYASSSALLKSANWDGFKELIAAQDEEDLLTACDCSADDMHMLANIYANIDMKPVASIIGWGIQRHVYGGENVRFINALAFLSGQVGRRGGGVYFNISSGRNLNTAWAKNAGTPARRLLLPAIGREILAATPTIKFLWADGSNFVNQTPDAASNVAAMDSIDFKVVVDAFMTDTAMRADIILPCALNHEREEILGSCLHNCVQYSAAVFPPAGQARHDFDIMTDLAARLGITPPAREYALRQALDVPHLSTTLEELRARGFAVAEHPCIAWEDYDFAHPDGKYRLPDALHTEPAPPQGYPLNLMSLVHRDYLHSQMPEKEQSSKPTVWVNPGIAMLGALDQARPIYLATPKGRIKVQVEVLKGLHPECVIIRRGGWMKFGNCANPLIEPRITDIGETAAYYSQHARLEN